MQPKIELKGIISFLIITFLITYAIEVAMIATGFRFAAVPGMFGQLVVFAAMWVPTLATIITTKFITHEKPMLTNWRLGSIKAYLGVAIVLPVCFAIVYGITWALGLAQVDLTLEPFRAMILETGANFPPIPNPTPILFGLFFASVIVAPFFNSLIALGEEIGWRGYLLPRLMPLGKTKAYIILGIVWGLWHMPLVLIGFTYPNQPILGTLLFITMTTALGIYINELTLQNNSVIIAAWAHGIFNCQKLGVWSLIFPKYDPLIGGFAGIIGIVVWFVLGMTQSKFVAARNDKGDPNAR